MSVIRKIVLGNGTEFEITNNISEIDLLYKGLYTKGASFEVVNSNLEEIQAAFKNAADLNTIKEMDENGTEVLNTYDGFTDMYSIGIGYADGEATYTVTLARPVDYQKAIEEVKAAQAETSKQVTEVQSQLTTLTTDPDPSKMELNGAIEYLAQQSKNELSAYLEEHPITSNVHGGVDAKYSITREKQNMLTSMILMTQMATQAGLEYQPSWNATNEPCTYDWTVDELQQLAVQIEATVRPLISLQQTIESNIRKATTVEDAIAAAVRFEDAVAAKEAEE